MTLKDYIKGIVGEEEFNNVLAEARENIVIETKNYKNTKKISYTCLIIGVLCLFFPPFWIGAAILLVIGLATFKLKTDAKKTVDVLHEVLYFLTEDLESSRENFDRYKYLIDQL